ncbi:UbiA family prenyltransferase [uncultured Dokdonia sp.]|uniref:UbiA family prenyltransferase n=1 Tax=uncultured Dokdonia sp. TaxID=575653 RepID=UPI00262FB132|nr:UbiA family prenyltransferase [uncultured Dokdonia sp.]
MLSSSLLCVSFALQNLEHINFLKDIKISRPGLWFPTVWIYLVPFSLDTVFWKEPIFWIGLFFVMFPLNYLVYGLNDYNDIASDKVNDRKGNFLFGAKASQQHLATVPKKIAIVLLPFFIYFTFRSGIYMLLLLVFMVAINIIYNFKPFRIKERPPFEICIQIGYVFTAFFSVLLNDLTMIPWQTILYLTLFAFQAHIAGEIMDIEPDRLAGKKTTATLIGRKNTKYFMLVLLLLETYILAMWFQDYVLAGFLGIFSIWLLLDVFIFFKEKPYSVAQMKLFGIAMNLSALASMLWALYSGKLLHPVF